MKNRKFTKKLAANGSALILAVVLTSLLAIVGAMFVMSARVDKVSTSAIAENKDLISAVELVVAEISQQLVADVPGIDPNGEYYDYPDQNDPWLADLEPKPDPNDPNNYYWVRITDLYSNLDANNLKPKIIPDYNETVQVSSAADADGDGVADSRWVELTDITSNKGKPIYAAVRIIDNAAMLNVNTAYKFAPTTANGSSQMHINLAAISVRGANGTLDAAADKLQLQRCDSMPTDIELYKQNVIWQYGKPNGLYTPFDISDELKLRNRYILNYNLMVSQIEEVWENAWDGDPYVPRNTRDHSINAPEDWFWYANNSSPDVCDYDYRHIATTYNMDRAIKPDGNEMANINTVDANSLYYALSEAFADSGLIDANMAAQLAINIIDFRDNDSDVSTLDVDNDGIADYYGIEAQPFISEIGAVIDPCNPGTDSEYAIELYNPFDVPIPLDDFTLSVSNGDNFPLSGTINPGDFFVIANTNPFDSNNTPDQPEVSLRLSGSYVPNPTPPPDFSSWDSYNITLKRNVNGTPIYLDRQPTQKIWFVPDTKTYLERDDDDWHIVYQIMGNMGASGSLGADNSAFVAGAKNYNLGLANSGFVTIGDIARPLIVGPSADPNDMMIGKQLESAASEADIRIDLTDTNYNGIFKYLTVWPPSQYVSDPCETRIKGRININTAPWYVIAQLPWMKYTAVGDNYQRAQEIVDARIANGFYGSIGELIRVGEMRNLSSDGSDNLNSDPNEGPDFTDDTALDDFEERDLIFSRISNLVTVRSDVFTAYILVRVGTDGPQKRVIAILDRSDVKPSGGKVRIIALHPVPDPR